MKKTKVYITVDTECREERILKGKFFPSAGYELRIWGKFRNQKRELGIKLIMDTLEHYNFRASFYLDPFSAKSLGIDGLKLICDELLQRGHDVQLHAHPIQQSMNLISDKSQPISDKIYDYSLDEQTSLLHEGIDILNSCGVPANSLNSFRAGHFSANNDTWKAMKEANLTLSSNYNYSYLDKSCRIKWKNDNRGLFDTGEGIYELPITNFLEQNGSYRHLQIAAISAKEMQELLRQAHRNGYSEVTILTHSFEHYFIDSVSEQTGRINRINYGRLSKLASFLYENDDKFEVETVGELGKSILANTGKKNQLPTVYPPLRGRRYLKLLRQAEQLWKRIEEKLR